MHFQKLYTEIFDGADPHKEITAMLKEVTNAYPYFSLAHFFLLKQAIDTGGDIDPITSKVALHFNNPFLLNEQLHKGKSLVNGVENKAVVKQQEITTVPVPDLPQEEEILPLAPMTSNEITEIPATPVEELFEPEIKEELPADNLPLTEKTAEPPVVEKQQEEPPLFEPLFASDYFASQGIKLSEEQQPTDRMGKQLKSFTEWLKTMKKVHDPKLSSIDPQVDITVQNLAEKSNKEEVVLTEAMADVFLQQGKTNKAKEIYEKLSLLNPSKSAYFAAKLDQIK